MNVRALFRTIVVILAVLPLLGRSVLLPADKVEQVRAFTRLIEFDYMNWMLDAMLLKGTQAAIAAPRYLSSEEQKKTVLSFLSLQERISELERQIELIYADPNIHNPQAEVDPMISELAAMQEERDHLRPLGETVMQTQISAVLSDLDLGLGGQPFPPVLFHISQMPQALIVSPRSVIRQDVDVSLLPELPLQEMIALEYLVEAELGVSALVEPVGGVGVYPTMVMNTTNLPSLLEIISHEWTHNFLTLRPLGVNYYTTPELRTMNETTANLVGKEVSLLVIERFYPEYLPAPPLSPENQSADFFSHETIENLPEVFDFRAEMHTTRVTVDAMLEDGRVDEAEVYMEERRRYIWENGYHIRRLNQAYFAFHGAYADTPFGAAGEDPVGPAVRTLRQQSVSLSEFLNRISWMTSFEALQKAIHQGR